MADLCLIIVSYNTGSLLTRCLDSIRKQNEVDQRVIIVDNASVDQTVELIRAGYPEVKLIANTRNVGFAAANNQAIAKIGKIEETPEGLLFFSTRTQSCNPAVLLQRVHL